jgi:hypothetical protein
LGFFQARLHCLKRAISPERWRFGLEAFERPISERQCDIGADRGANKARCWANFDRAFDAPVILFLVMPTVWVTRREFRDFARDDSVTCE